MTDQTIETILGRQGSLQSGEHTLQTQNTKYLANNCMLVTSYIKLDYYFLAFNKLLK